MSDASFSYPGTELEALFQSKNYYRWIMRHFSPYVGRHIAEVGAGVGTFSEALASRSSFSELYLFEPAANLVGALRKRFGARDRVTVIEGFFEDYDELGPVDSIITVNVLEHMEEDEAFMRRAMAKLVPGGYLLVFVPALPALFGSLDRAFEHYRRYTRRSLAKKLVGAGFRVEKLQYLNFPGIISWFIAGRVLRRRTLRPAQMWVYDRLVVSWVSKLEWLIPPPVGQNLVAVARKPLEGGEVG